MSHFNYTLFPVDERSKPAAGIKKNEAFDFIISKHKSQNKSNPNLYRNYVYGCHCESYELYTNDFNITSNDNCNKAIKQELLILLKEMHTKRQKLNDTLQSYPYGTLFDQSCSRSGDLLRWFGNKFGFTATLLIFSWIWWFMLFFEFIFCYPIYFFLESRRVPPTVEQMEEWFDSKICSNSAEFDAENLDNFVVERLQEICNNLNDKFSQYGISLKPFTYVDAIEVASYDEGGSNGGHVNHFTKYYDEFLIMNDDDNKLSKV